MGEQRELTPAFHAGVAIILGFSILAASPLPVIVADGEEVLVVMERGKVVRSSIDEVPAKGRNTMGVVFAKPGKNDRIIAVTRGPEQAVEDEAQTPVDDATVEAAVDALDPSDPASTATESEDEQ